MLLTVCSRLFALLHSMTMRIGYGEDSHSLAEGQPLVIGGVKIESDIGAVAHSDGDVLLHALSDALLSTFALGDIGFYFPPSNPDFKDMNSQMILERVLLELSQHAPDFQIQNVAAVVMLDKPKLGKYREMIQNNVANLLGLKAADVGITFKTSEGMALGHVQARVTLLLNTERV
jgi:2-C-methyl-D-erythritol 2,4-cyclodiphosphate synthase